MPKRTGGRDGVFSLRPKQSAGKKVEGKTGVRHRAQRKPVKNPAKESENLGAGRATRLSGGDKTVAEVRRLSGLLRGSKISVDEALAAAVLARRLKEMGLTAAEVSDFVDEVLDECRTKAFAVSKLVRCSKELSEAEGATKMTYAQIVADARAKAKEMAHHSADVKALEEDVKRLEGKRQDLVEKYEAKERGLREDYDMKRKKILKEYNATEDDLILQREMQQRLKEVGADPSDPQKLIRMISSAAEVGYSPATFAEKLKEERSAMERLGDLKEQAGREKGELDGLISTADQAGFKLDELNVKTVEARKRLDDLTLKEGVLDGTIIERLERLKELDSEIGSSASRVGGLEEVMKHDGILVKLFREPSSLTVEDVKSVAAQLRIWAKEMPAEASLGRQTVKMAVDAFADSLGDAQT